MPGKNRDAEVKKIVNLAQSKDEESRVQAIDILRKDISLARLMPKGLLDKLALDDKTTISTPMVAERDLIGLLSEDTIRSLLRGDTGYLLTRIFTLSKEQATRKLCVETLVSHATDAIDKFKETGSVDLINAVAMNKDLMERLPKSLSTLIEFISTKNFKMVMAATDSVSKEQLTSELPFTIGELLQMDMESRDEGLGVYLSEEDLVAISNKFDERKKQLMRDKGNKSK